MVELRLDRRLSARIDASDVVQEAYVNAITRLDEYLRNPNYPLFLWLRLIVGERLLKLHRHHLGTQMRDAGLEVSLYHGALPAASSAALAAQLLGKHTSPTQAAVRAERMLRLQEALNTLSPIDREVLSLRHFEELTLAETALALGIEESAAAKRYVRALKRLKAILATMPGGLEVSDHDLGEFRRLYPADSARRRVRRAVSGRRTAVAPGVHRPLSRAGRRHPRAAPGYGRDRAGREDHQEAAEPAAPPAPALRQLGDFRILREVGRGGMGIVYEAEQVSLGRHVALKVLPKSMLLDARAKRRFEREAKAAARLHHTNIVPVFGVGEQEGLPLLRHAVHPRAGAG